MERVFVNGAFIEKDFLKEKIDHALTYEWTKAIRNYIEEDHYHCMICSAGINPEKQDCYKDGNEWLCKYCYDRFLIQKESI